MTSNDVYLIVNDEQSFRLYVVEQFGKIDARLENLEFRVGNLESEVKSLHAEIKHVSSEQIAFSTQMNMLLWGAGIIIGAATLAVTIWSIFKPSRKEKPETSPAPTVITIPQPQVDIQAIARQLGEMFNLEPKR